MAKADQGSKPSNLTDCEYDAGNARRVLGFKILCCFDEFSDTQKTTVVSHNMNILKNLPSEIKMSIIKKCIRNESDDYVGLQYMVYDGGQKNIHVAEEEPKRGISKKRSSLEFTDSEENKEGEENWTRPKKKKKVVSEEIKGEKMEQQNPMKEYFLKNRLHIGYADYEEEKGEKQTLPKKKTKKTTKKERRREKGRARKVVPMPAPVLSEEIKGKIVELNGTDINWVFTKRLFFSDVRQDLTRFSMPLNQIDISFLMDEEREKLDEELGVEVRMVGPTGEFSRLTLKKWRMEKPSGKVTITYNFINGWYKDIVEANGLKTDHLVHVWSFREGKNLSFALVKVDE